MRRRWALVLGIISFSAFAQNGQAGEQPKRVLYQIQCNAAWPVSAIKVQIFESEELCFQAAEALDAYSGCFELDLQDNAGGITLPKYSYYCDSEA